MEINVKENPKKTDGKGKGGEKKGTRCKTLEPEKSKLGEKGKGQRRVMG